MEDQQTCEFWFKITPTKIVSNSKGKSCEHQTVLIKLGNKEAKCPQVGTLVELTVDVLYSKTLNKFCPIKGIIKVYDVGDDGSEMISCVGAFNTEDLLSHGHKVTEIQREIGGYKIYILFEVQKKDPQNPIPSETKHSKPPVHKLHSISQKDFNEGPFIIDDSSVEEECYHSRCSEISEDLRDHERKAIGEELVEERRKNKILEEKIEKCNIKNQLLKKNLNQKNNEIRLYNQNFKSFTASLESDSRGQYKFEINERTREVSLKYKINVNFKSTFESFIEFMIRKMTENSASSSIDRSQEDETELNKLLEEISSYQSEKKFHNNEISSLKTELASSKLTIENLTNALSQKSQALQQNTTISTSLSKQIQHLQTQLKEIKEEKENLEEELVYIREGFGQMERDRDSKEKIIESLEEIVAKSRNELHLVHEKNRRLEDNYNNLTLKLEELQEENENLLETIESYREQFGDLKAAKDRALEREIKECLRWIDQQNRDEELSLQEDTTLTFSEPPTVGSFMRSIDEIEKMPQGEIELIRNEVMGVLKKLDELVAKNSFAGIST